MKATRTAIQRAWCVELGREVTITEARREYLSLEKRPHGFTFYCNDPACRNVKPRILVSGVNYRKAAEETEVFRIAHFRAHNRHPHQENCSWLTGEVDEADDVESTDITREARAKRTDLITVFDPRIESTCTTQKPYHVPGSSQKIDGVQGVWHGYGKSSEKIGETVTSDLDRLVDSYLEAKATLPTNEFRNLKLRIVGQGEIGYREYFQWIGVTDGHGITYGGATLHKRYMEGFRLRFFDQRENEPVFLYIGRTQLLNYRYWRHLSGIIDIIENQPRITYVQVFAIGTISYDSQRRHWSLEVENLSHLTLIVRSKKALEVATFESAPSSTNE